MNIWLAALEQLSSFPRNHLEELDSSLVFLPTSDLVKFCQMNVLCSSQNFRNMRSWVVYVFNAADAAKNQLCFVVLLTRVDDTGAIDQENLKNYKFLVEQQKSNLPLFVRATNCQTFVSPGIGATLQT